MPEPRNPFVGPRPFQREESPLFYGREREARELAALVAASQVVIVHGSSGAGKTSLLNAAMVPLLEQDGFEVLPVVRVDSLHVDEPLPSHTNTYVAGFLSSLASVADADDAAGPPARVVDFFARRDHVQGPDGFAVPWAVLVDQSEDVFSLYPERWDDEREEFFAQIAETLDSDPLLRVVFSLREDYLAEIDSYAPLFRDGMRARLRLRPLRRDDALRAVDGPVSSQGRHFAPGVAETLVEDLRARHIDRGRAGVMEVRGEFVEPMLLQVVCYSLWENLPAESVEIRYEDLQAVGGADAALTALWDAALGDAARGARTSEKRLRRSIEEALVTPAGTRGFVYRGIDTTAAIPNRALDELEYRQLVRTEFRAGARWSELVHDRLIEPLRTSNARFARSRRRFALGRR